MEVIPAASSPAKGPLVIDFLGRVYVAVHPGYASAFSVFYRVLACRVIVASLACATCALCVAGQVVPTYSARLGNSSSLTSIWSTWETTPDGTYSVHRFEEEMQAVAVLSAILAFAAVVLSVALAVVWVALERCRSNEEQANWTALNQYGQRSIAHDGAADPDAFPFTNVCVENRGQVSRVPCELRERRRRLYEKNVAIVTLLLLILAGVFAVTSLGLMACDYDEYKLEFPHDGQRIGAAIPLFAVATGLCLCAIVLLAIPGLTQAHLCGSLRPERCMLMVVEDAVAGAVGEEIRRLMAAGNPLASSIMAGVPVALPGPQIGSMLMPPPALQQQHDQRHHATASAPSAGQREAMAEAMAAAPGYCTAEYFEAPPQLFRVHKDPLEDVAVAAEVAVPPRAPEAQRETQAAEASDAAAEMTDMAEKPTSKLV